MAKYYWELPKLALLIPMTRLPQRISCITRLLACSIRWILAALYAVSIMLVHLLFDVTFTSKRLDGRPAKTFFALSNVNPPNMSHCTMTSVILLYTVFLLHDIENEAITSRKQMLSLKHIILQLSFCYRHLTRHVHWAQCVLTAMRGRLYYTCTPNEIWLATFCSEVDDIELFCVQAASICLRLHDHVTRSYYSVLRL